MKIRIISDIHLDSFVGWQGPDVLLEDEAFEDPDVLVFAGDLRQAGDMMEKLQWFSDAFKQVVFVPGNHDYYHGSFDTVAEDIVAVNDHYDNVHVLQNDSVTIDGQRFIGGTMWFRDHPMNAAHCMRMNDFRIIENFAERVYIENAVALKYLSENVRKGDVVVTHHSPNLMSSHPRYANDPLNRFYVCDTSDIMMDKKPAIWAHGHTHDSYDYTIDETRVVCNPYGYRTSWFNHKFNPGMIIEI